MKKENLIWLKDFVTYRTMNPFYNRESDNQLLNKFRDNAISAIKEYKDAKKRLELKNKENEIIENILIDLQKQIEENDAKTTD